MRISKKAASLCMLALAVATAGCGSGRDAGGTSGSALNILVRAVSCNSQTKACVDLLVPDALIVVTLNDKIVGKGTTGPDANQAHINLATSSGRVHVVITSAAIQGGKQETNININDTLTSSTIDYPLAAGLGTSPS